MHSKPSNETAISPTYQHVIVKGLPYERGLTHGRRAQEKVCANVHYYRTPGKLVSPHLIDQIIDQVYKPAIKMYYPAALDEMQGIADGAGVTLDDIILLNSRYDLARIDEPDNSSPPAEVTLDQANECTSAFFLKETNPEGHVINSQNWDMSARLWKQDAIIYLEVHPDPSENKPNLFLVTEAGQLGRSGMNSLGIGVTANSLMSSDDYVPLADVDARAGPQQKFILPISLLRRMVLECNHLSEAFTAVFNFPRHVSNNLTIATAEGFGVCLEITPDRAYKVYGDIDDHYLVHTNHFTHAGFESRADIRDRYPGGSSWHRRRRFEQGIRGDALAGRLTQKKLITAFSDHLSYPEALCCHPDDSPVDAIIGHLPGYPFRGSTATVACVMYNLTTKTVTVCKGPPCQGKFETFQLHGPSASEIRNSAVSRVDNKLRPEVP
ncbi:peptidase C45 acyl-coenzyme A:6-aminopenicillanic acid acyl-transferase [Talaromyces proteolyticus]|uniref:Peptidase C45 acyl-coenzyme A:6-aminopenicillanic acid acyl-transferase n=1 Tax=Talaromyces proteolyticus TaxID=1131652 RepID=A0AAD4KLA5_9EURO|nr:peptidase C45 acyl-coenzyme A:6-aminopenicillanic acid acyl-transferase [Talaromyces proteolyticus]KAH8693889.1 peptidase C45 acyl-coenzyme A:6-aminopenicillanic acid acyl-transferase [Talaromyces proteolyticus]